MGHYTLMLSETRESVAFQHNTIEQVRELKKQFATYSLSMVIIDEDTGLLVDFEENPIPAESYEEYQKRALDVYKDCYEEKKNTRTRCANFYVDRFAL